MVAAVGAHFPLHGIRAAGLELAAVKLRPSALELTCWLVGCVVTESTVKVAALVVAVPAMLVKTAWYSSPFSSAVA